MAGDAEHLGKIYLASGVIAFRKKRLSALVVNFAVFPGERTSIFRYS